MSTFDSPDSTERDRRLGAALKALGEPPTPDSFWDDLSHQLAELDGEIHQPIHQQRNNVISLDSWRKNSSRVLLTAAAAVVALAGGLALAGVFSNDTTDVQTIDENPVDGTTDDSDNGEDSLATDDDVSGPDVDYAGRYRVNQLPAGASVVGGDPFVDSVILTVPLADSEATGCEGGERVGLSTQSSDGVVHTAPSELPDLNYVIQNHQNRLIVGSQCEEFIDLSAIAGLQGEGRIQVDGTLPSIFDNVDDIAFIGRPVWSADHTRILVNVSSESGDPMLVEIGADTGEILGARPVERTLLAELAGGVGVNQSDDGIEVNGTNITMADSQGNLFVQTAVSLDQTMVAAWSGSTFVVVDTSGTTLVELRDEDEIAGAAWTTSGRLITTSTVDPDLIVWSPRTGEDPILVQVELGTAGWSSIAVADDGQVVAVSTFDGEQLVGYTLRFDRIGDENGIEPTGEADESDTSDGRDDQTGAQTTTSAVDVEPDEPVIQPDVTVSFADQQLDLQGMGPVRHGMTVSEANIALGVSDAFVVDINPDISSECGYAVLQGDGNSPRFMVTGRADSDPREAVIARIELLEGQTTVDGIGIGDSVEEMRAVYDGELDFMADESSENIFVYGPTDFNEVQYRLVFESIDGVITSVRSGRFPEVGYIEGCL